MAEIWGAAIMMGGALIGGMGKQKEKEADQKFQAGQTREEAINALKSSEFNAAQDYYYERLGKQNQQRGMNEFRKFSTVRQFNPSYSDSTTDIVLPNKPNYKDYFPDAPAKAKKKKKRSFLGKLADPAGLFSDSTANKLGDPAGLFGG